MGKTLRNAKGKKYKPNSKEQQKKPKDQKGFHAHGSGEKYGNRSGWSTYPKHIAKDRKNPPPPFDDEL